MKSDYQKCVHKTERHFRLENRRYIYTFLNFECTHLIKLFMEVNDSVSELKDSVREGGLITITPEMCRQVTPNVLRLQCPNVPIVLPFAALRPVGLPILQESV